MSTTDVDERVNRAIVTFNDHDLDALLGEFAEDGAFTDPLIDGTVSGEELRGYTNEIFEGFSDVRLEVERTFTSADGDVAIEGRYVGTHDGPLQGVPPTGNAVEIPTVTVFDVGPDGIEFWRDYWNEQAFADQLGLTFPAIVPKLPRMAVAKLRGTV